MNPLKNTFVNRVLRFCTLKVNIINGQINSSLKRIRVSGNVDLNIGDIKFKMFAKWDDGIVDSIYFNRHDYDEVSNINLFCKFAQKSEVIFDIGANTGVYSICSAISNKKAKIYSFEPFEINRTRLKYNLTLNSLNDSVNVFDSPLGDSEKEVEFTIPETDTICDALSVDATHTNKYYKEFLTFKQIKVNQISLDYFIKENNIKTIDLMKIDVENYELNVLKGALKSLEHFSPIIFIESFVDDERARFFNKTIKDLGYNFYAMVDDRIINLDEFEKISDQRDFILSKKPLTVNKFNSIKEFENSI